MVEVTPESVAANAAAEEALDQANTAMEEVPRSRPREPVMSIFGETAYEAAQAAETESEKARKTKKETAAREEELRDRGGRKKEGLTPEQERGFENFDVRKFLKFLQELPKLPKQEPLKQEFLKQELPKQELPKLPEQKLPDQEPPEFTEANAIAKKALDATDTAMPEMTRDPLFDKTTKAAEAGKDKATEETKKAEATVNRDGSKSQEPPKAAPKSVAADTAEEALDQANTTMQRAPRSRQSGEELAQKRAERDTRKRQSEEELAQKRIARDARKQAEKDWSKIVMAQKRAARNVRKQVEKDKLATAIKKRDRGWAVWEEGADSPIRPLSLRPLSRTQQENMSWIKRQRGEQVSEKMNRPSAVEPPEKPVATEEDKKSLDRLDKIALNTAKLADRPIIQLEPLGVAQ
jgi:hypothetical protein